MKVKDIVITALKMLGQNPLSEKLAAGAETGGGERETVSVLVHCFNAVEDEVARCYIPLCATESIAGDNGKFYFSALSHTPVRITGVKAGGDAIAYKIFPAYILADADEISVWYDYSPKIKDLDGVSEFCCAAGEYLFACGVAAEYCIINGEIEAAEIWESKYRQEIESVRAKSLPQGGYIPPRRWV